jgi:hypothetical protein
VGDDSHVVLANIFCGERSVRLRCRDTTSGPFIAKIRGEVLAHFQAVAVKVTVIRGIDCLACQDKFFVNNLLDVKENYEHALEFVFHLSRLLVSVSLDFRALLMLSSSNARLIIVRGSIAYFRDMHKI